MIELTGKNDEYGNFWLDEPIHISAIAAEMYEDLPEDLRAFSSDPFKNLVLAFGKSDEDLAKGFKAKDMNPRDYGFQYFREPLAKPAELAL